MGQRIRIVDSAKIRVICDCFIRFGVIYGWQYDGQGGYGIVGTTDHEIDYVLSALAVNDLSLLVARINIQ